MGNDDFPLVLLFFFSVIVAVLIAVNLNGKRWASYCGDRSGTAVEFRQCMME